jgi:transcription initiation factor TFIID TATA-box-binding protein
MNNKNPKNETKYKHVVLKPTYRVENIVASADMKADLDLYNLAKISSDIDYEPEQFPGAILKIHEPKAALLLFKNGKVICTGAHTKADVVRAVSQAVALVNKYRNMLRLKQITPSNGH